MYTVLIPNTLHISMASLPPDNILYVSGADSRPVGNRQVLLLQHFHLRAGLIRPSAVVGTVPLPPATGASGGTFGDMATPERLERRHASTDDDDERLGPGPDDQVVRFPRDVGSRGEGSEISGFDDAADGGAVGRNGLVSASWLVREESRGQWKKEQGIKYQSPRPRRMHRMSRFRKVRLSCHRMVTGRMARTTSTRIFSAA